MGNFINLRGRRFGNLLVIRLIGSNDRRKLIWECICVDKGRMARRAKRTNLSHFAFGGPAIAAKYGVTHQAVYAILDRTHWRHL
jgi:hypothetical protein